MLISRQLCVFYVLFVFVVCCELYVFVFVVSCWFVHYCSSFVVSCLLRVVCCLMLVG